MGGGGPPPILLSYIKKMFGKCPEFCSFFILKASLSIFIWNLSILFCLFHFSGAVVFLADNITTFRYPILCDAASMYLIFVSLSVDVKHKGILKYIGVFYHKSGGIGWVGTSHLRYKFVN